MEGFVRFVVRKQYGVPELFVQCFQVCICIDNKELGSNHKRLIFGLCFPESCW